MGPKTVNADDCLITNFYYINRKYTIIINNIEAMLNQIKEGAR